MSRRPYADQNTPVAIAAVLVFCVGVRLIRLGNRLMRES